ncbi:MAG: SBBP repeat-containing protein [Acidobacteriota bacterium]|nr:SBBP repeat-containing protein [Acidobacteriota bacterium]
MRRLSSFVAFLPAIALQAADLQWVKQIGGTGQTAAVASATDRQGNLYIVGNTSSLAFPLVAATQAQPGGSPLMRIDSASGTAQLLTSPLLTNAAKFTVDPQNSSTLYAAADSGLIRSTDSGASWNRIDTFPAVSIIASITIDPSDSNIIYVSANTRGLFRSVDGGIDWSELNQGIPPPVNTSFYVNQLWVDPAASSVLFATSSSGLIRSADSGASWTVVLVIDIASSLAFDPFAPGTIYESGAGRGSSTVNKSIDDGVTWTLLAAAPMGYPNQLLADPFDAGVLYFSDYLGLYQSKDGGATWTFKTRQLSVAIAADPARPVLYASLGSSGIVRSTDGFSTYQPLSTTASPATQILIAGSQLFVATAPSTDLFTAKLDGLGTIVYSTYFGGSGADTAAGLAPSADGSIYVTGSTTSFDFPVTDGVYLSNPPPGGSRSFLFKLNPDGSLAWSTYFADSRTTALAIAVDETGSPYITGATNGGLPVTNDAYQKAFTPISPCGGIPSIGPCPPPPTSAFLTKFNPDGSGLVFSTYMSHDSRYANAQLLKGPR